MAEVPFTEVVMMRARMRERRVVMAVMLEKSTEAAQRQEKGVK